MDSEPIGTADTRRQDKLLAAHVQGLARMFRGTWARLVTFIEINLSANVAGCIATTIDKAALGHFAVEHARRGGRDGHTRLDVGLSTTNEVKMRMVQTTNALMTAGRIQVFRRLVCAGNRHGIEGDDKRAASVVGLLREQLKRVHQSIRPPTSVHSEPKTTISGKSGTKQDDLAFSFMLGVHWALGSIKAPGSVLLRAT